MAVSQSLTVTQESQNKVANTSVIRIKWTSTQSGASHNSYTNTAYYYVSINGGAETKYSASYTLPKSSTTTIVNKTLTVNHNANGVCSVKVRTWMDTEISAGTVQKSKTLTLDTIPRKSVLTVANGTLGTAQTLTVSRQATSFTHSIKVVCGSLTRYIKADGTFSTTEVKHNDCSIPFTLPLTWANQNTTGKSVSVKFTITTYSGSSTIGSNTYTKSFTIPSSVGPGVPTISISDPTGYSSIYGGYVQNKSTAQVSATASTENSQGATISSYTIYLNGNKCSGTTLTLPSTGLNTIKVVATDSRGYTSSKSTTIDVLAYSKPTISLTPTKSNTDLILSYKLTYTPLNGKNKVKIDLYSNPRLLTDTTIISDGTETTGDYIINNIDPDTTYNNVYVRVTDALGEYGDSTKSTIWGSERVFNVPPSGQGISFGKKATKDNCLESKWLVQTPGLLSTRNNVNGNVSLLPADLNIEPTEDLKGCLESYCVKNTATNGPGYDGHILHSHWYNANGNDIQLFTRITNGELMSRSCYNNTWGGWRRQLDSENYTDYAASKPVQLYSNNTGTYSTITWSNAKASDFKFLEIFYMDNYSDCRKSTRVFLNYTSGITAELSYVYPNTTATDLTVTLRTSIYTINDSSLTWSKGKNITLKDNQSVGVTNVTAVGADAGQSKIKITGIFGYK